MREIKLKVYYTEGVFLVTHLICYVTLMIYKSRVNVCLLRYYMFLLGLPNFIYGLVALIII